MTRIDELLATPPAERPRKGPRRWERSTDRSCTGRFIWRQVCWLARGGFSSPEMALGWTACWDPTWGPSIRVSPRDPLLMDMGRQPHTQRWRSEVVAWCRQMGEVKLP